MDAIRPHAHFEIMKTPNRNFVVEYKGTRKRDTSQPKSIWGDIDLRSAAKSVEAEWIRHRRRQRSAKRVLSLPWLSRHQRPLPFEEPVVNEAAETFVALEETAEDHSSVPPQVHGLEQPPADKITPPPRKARGNDVKPRRRRTQVAAMMD
jgi:hypothetical protein